MKKTLSTAFISSLLLISSCAGDPTGSKEIINDKGVVSVLDGKEQKIEVKYDCTGCKDHLDSQDLFDTIITQANRLTHNALNYPLSHVPKSFELTVNREDSLYYFDNGKKIDNLLSVIFNSKYIAKNAYGTEIEGDMSGSFLVKDGKVADIDDEIKLPDLELDDHGFVRSLSLYTDDFEGGITIQPDVEDKEFIVKSTFNCVDEGSLLALVLQNNESIFLYSWNDFNCDGASYFHSLKLEEVEQLKKQKVILISFTNDGETMFFYIPKNQADYFQQLMKIFYASES